MLDFGFYLMDCMAGMKEFPDNYFDLAIVDPPYGAGFADNGGCEGWFSKYKRPSELRGGYKNTPSTQELQKAGRNVGLCELEERGRRSFKKNCRVGHSPETGIF